MSTNYYFKFTGVTLYAFGNARESTTFSRLIKEMEDTLNELKYIHIGKRSVGWKPLFQKTEFFSSVEEVENFHNENKGRLTIVDEYDNEFTLDGLRSALFDWNKKDIGARSHLDVVTSFEAYADKDGYEFLNADFG